MADAAGSETAPGTRSIKKEKDADPTTGTDASGMKKEKDADPTQAGHPHHFRVKFGTAVDKYNINCKEPGTVLRAIKTSNAYNTKFSDENPVIQLGETDREYAIATHFPCICITEGECLILSHEKEKIERTEVQPYKPIQSKEMYSVFYIDRVGGKYTKTKTFIRSTDFNDFKYLCVYGEKGKTVEDALRRDGRFIDDLGNFTLSDNTDRNIITECTQPVDNLDRKKCKLCLEKKSNEKADGEKVKQTRLGIPKTMEKSPLSDKDSVDRVGAENESEGKSGSSGSSVDITEIYGLLQKQCAALRELMMRRFPGDLYQETLNLKKEDFGKIQQSFSDVHRVRKLIKLGDSVCKVILESGCKGTGFVLFDNFILTNAHLFKRRDEKGIKRLTDDIKGKVTFDFEEEDNNYHYFQLAPRYICYCDDDLDYAILELEPVGQQYNPETKEDTEEKVPPGLLERFGPMPDNGEACIIGHPGGGVKQLDPTSIIEIENREKVVGNAFIVHKINVPKKQDVKSIYVGGKKAETGTTYNTFMYKGSSGSPVFDAQCKVFGLHTLGYGYNPETSKGVIEWAQPLLTIFEDFVSKLRENEEEGLLRRVEEVAKGNSDLEEKLRPKKDTQPRL